MSDLFSVTSAVEPIFRVEDGAYKVILESVQFQLDGLVTVHVNEGKLSNQLPLRVRKKCAIKLFEICCQHENFVIIKSTGFIYTALVDVIQLLCTEKNSVIRLCLIGIAWILNQNEGNSSTIQYNNNNGNMNNLDECRDSKTVETKNNYKKKEWKVKLVHNLCHFYCQQFYNSYHDMANSNHLNNTNQKSVHKNLNLVEVVQHNSYDDDVTVETVSDKLSPQYPATKSPIKAIHRKRKFVTKNTPIDTNSTTTSHINNRSQKSYVATTDDDNIMTEPNDSFMKPQLRTMDDNNNNNNNNNVTTKLSVHRKRKYQNRTSSSSTESNMNNSQSNNNININNKYEKERLLNNTDVSVSVKDKMITTATTTTNSNSNTTENEFLLFFITNMKLLAVQNNHATIIHLLDCFNSNMYVCHTSVNITNSSNNTNKTVALTNNMEENICIHLEQCLSLALINQFTVSALQCPTLYNDNNSKSDSDSNNSNSSDNNNENGNDNDENCSQSSSSSTSTSTGASDSVSSTLSKYMKIFRLSYNNNNDKSYLEIITAQLLDSMLYLIHNDNNTTNTNTNINNHSNINNTDVDTKGDMIQTRHLLLQIQIYDILNIIEASVFNSVDNQNIILSARTESNDNNSNNNDNHKNNNNNNDSAHKSILEVLLQFLSTYLPFIIQQFQTFIYHTNNNNNDSTNRSNNNNNNNNSDLIFEIWIQTLKVLINITYNCPTAAILLATISINTNNNNNNNNNNKDDSSTNSNNNNITGSQLVIQILQHCYHYRLLFKHKSKTTRHIPNHNSNNSTTNAPTNTTTTTAIANKIPPTSTATDDTNINNMTSICHGNLLFSPTELPLEVS